MYHTNKQKVAEEEGGGGLLVNYNTFKLWAFREEIYIVLVEGNNTLIDDTEQQLKQYIIYILCVYLWYSQIQSKDKLRYILIYICI